MAAFCTTTASARLAIIPSPLKSRTKSRVLRRTQVSVRAAEDDKPDSGSVSAGRTGFVGADNSGRGNIFAVEPSKVYLSSPTRDVQAKEGLGGAQGGIAIGLAVVGVIAGVFVSANGSPEIVPESFDASVLKPLSYYKETL